MDTRRSTAAGARPPGPRRPPGASPAVLASALLMGLAVDASAAERKAVVTGLSDRSLTAEIERSIGDARTPVQSRLDARRRAREAAETADAVLRSEGWYDAAIAVALPDGPKPKPTLKIDLGPRTMLRGVAVVFDGAPPDPAAQAAAAGAVDLKTGAPGRAVDVVAAEGRLVALLQEHGYADAKADPREVVVDHADHAMRATFHVAAAAKVRMDGLKIDHIGRTRAKWLRSLVPWKVDEVYRPELVGEIERRLLETQVYDSVTVALAPQPDAQGRRPVVINLADRANGALDFSAGYSTTEGADFDVRYSIFNPLGRGDTVTLQARLAEIDSRFGGELSQPDWLRHDQTLKTSLYYLRTVTDAYTETGPEVAADLTRRYGKTSYITYGSSVTASHVDDKVLGSEDIQLFRIYGGFLWDRTDNALDPRRGFKLDARLTPTQITGDQTLTYLKATVQGSTYVPFDVAANNVLAVRMRVGSIVGDLSNPQGVPASDRFYAGGGGSVRGYDYQGVGPHALIPTSDGGTEYVPTGGLSLVETSLEFRHRFANSPLGVVAFVDAGSVTTNQVPDFSHVSSAVGLGVRYNLGFAPIRADIAVPLDKVTGDSGSFQIYLSIGQAF